MGALAVPKFYDTKVISIDSIKRKTKDDNSIDGELSNRTGQSCEVYAFRSKEEIEAMIKVFDKHIAEAPDNNKQQIAERNKLLFVVGINLGLRASDLRILQYDFFLNEDRTFKDFYVLTPMKTRKLKKKVKLFFNQTVRKAIMDYLKKYPTDSLDDYLFISRKGNNPINENTLWDIIKKTATEAGIKQNIGSHSLRKSWGYWAWHEAQDKSKALVTLQQCFNHSSMQTTLRYIGLLDDEISDMYNSIELGMEFL